MVLNDIMATKSKTGKDSKFARSKQKLWFQNLIALNFPAAAIKERYMISIYDGMFDKPNKNGFERIFHFLFCKLDKEKATELFRFCFPSYDTKSCQEFRTICLNWWKRIAGENSLFNFPRLSNSLLISPGGHEFYKVLFTFTTFVIYSEAKQMNVKGEDDTLLPPVPSKIKGISRAQIMALKSICHAESVEVFQNLQMDKYTDEKVCQQADSMRQQYRGDIKTRKLLEQQKKNFFLKLKMSANRTLGMTSRTRSYQTLEKILSTRTSRSLGSVRAMWNVLSSAIESTTEEREIIDSILCTDEVGRSLDAAKLAPKVPSALLLQCTHEVYETVGTSLFEAGQLNLVSLLKLFNLSLHLLIEKLHEVGVPNFENQIPYISTQSHIHAKNVIILNKIRQKLQQMIPETETRNITLRQQVDECYARRKLAESTLISGLPKPQFESTEVPELDNTTVDLPSICPPLQFSDNSHLTTPTVPHLLTGAKGVLFDIALPQNFLTSQDLLPAQITVTSQPSTRQRNSAQLRSKSTAPSLKQGSLQFSPHASPKTSRNVVGIKEALLQRRTMRHIPLSKAKGQVKAAELSADTPTETSVPSTPVIKQDDTTIQRIKSRTPEAMKNLISQVVDYTMLEMSVQPGDKPSEATPADKNLHPPFFDISSQLDMSVFESRDKVYRTPTGFQCNPTSLLIPEPVMKENKDPNGFPPVKSSISVSRDSKESSPLCAAEEIDMLSPCETLADKTKILADCSTKVVSCQAASLATSSGLYVSSHPITPYKLGLTAIDDLDFSNYQGLMDVEPPPDLLTLDFLLDTSSTTEPEVPPSVPVGNLIDL